MAYILSIFVCLMRALGKNKTEKGQVEDKSDGDPSAGREDTVAALGVVCDLLSDAMADRLLQAYQVPQESILRSSKTPPLKRKAAWETAMEVTTLLRVVLALVDMLS